MDNRKKFRLVGIRDGALCWLREAHLDEMFPKEQLTPIALLWLDPQPGDLFRLNETAVLVCTKGGDRL